MNPSHNIDRFRTNPVEIVILIIISSVFLTSVYNLLYDRKEFHPAALSPMTSNPLSENRSPSSVSQSLVTLQVPCDKPMEKEVQANKVRITGSFCGAESLAGNSSPVKASIVNTLNQYVATVFTDYSSGKYSTDYIPLTFGKNVIHVEFSFNNGKTTSQDFLLNKN